MTDAQNSSFVILFSKYSPVCKKFVDLIQSSDTANSIKFNYLCIDNKKIRNHILSSKSNFDIKHVPCLLIINKINSSVDKYEGQDCFIWINDIIRQEQQLLLLKQQQQQILLQEQITQQLINLQKTNEKSSPPKKSSEEDLSSSEFPESQSSTKTFIDDIDATLENDNEPSSSLPTSFDEIDSSSSFNRGDFESSSSGTPAKKRPDHAKRENLLSAAMQMQKSRELEDKSLNNKMPFS